MAYDEDLAQRVREVLSARSEVSERRMFGSLCFLVGGNLAVCARKGGELLVRLNPEEAEKAITEEGVRVAEMGPQKRQMKGWILVSPGAIVNDRALADWVDAGTDYAASLPPK